MSENNKWFLICDESGAKGFNDKPASGGPPIGVVAGLLLPESTLQKIEQLVPPLRSKYEPEDGKLHVTDLDATKQEELRKEVFEIIQESNGVVVYEAISQDGFHDWYSTQANFWNKIKDEGKGRGYGYTFSDHKTRLQTTLFLGCFLRGLAYLLDEETGKEFDIALLTDTMDKPILDEIEQELKGYLSFQSNEKIETVATRYNYQTGKVEKQEGTIEYDIKIPESQDIGDLSGVNVSVRIDNQLEIIADVLSNSIAYHLEQSFTKDNSIPLSSIDAINEHPLVSSMTSLTPKGGYDMNQALYQFPVGPEEIKSDNMRKPQDFAENIKFTPQKK